MSLLKRIGTTGPMPDNTTGTMGGQNGGMQNHATKPGTQPNVGSNPSTVLPRPTGRLAPNDVPANNRQATTGNEFQDLKNRVQQKLIAELDPKLDLSKTDEVRRQVEDIFNEILDSENIILTRVDRARLFEAVAAEILGFGPIEPLLKDASISEVMVNGPKSVYIERHGRLEKTNIQFQNDEHVMRVIDRIVAPLGRRIDEASPYVDARLPDGSRVNAIIPPLALNGPTITIRKFSKDPLTVDDLIRFGSMTPEMGTFLKACVEARLNII
ncbi:MAG: Flp pilus assembly complex ATPase component TadA, partial [Chloroflexota bacterium]|nr:Flp pilus assembly complex ATPase component TadA [Chloroflexota bacterium]